MYRSLVFFFTVLSKYVQVWISINLCLDTNTRVGFKVDKLITQSTEPTGQCYYLRTTDREICEYHVY